MKMLYWMMLSEIRQEAAMARQIPREYRAIAR